MTKDTNDLGPKDLPWQRPSRHDPALEIRGPRLATRTAIAKALRLEPQTVDEDHEFYQKIDDLIAGFQHLPQKRDAYQPIKQRAALLSIVEAIERLKPVSRKRLLLGIGKAKATKGGKAKVTVGQEVLENLLSGIELALGRTKPLPKGNRELEDLHWLTKKLANLLRKKRA